MMEVKDERVYDIDGAPVNIAARCCCYYQALCELVPDFQPGGKHELRKPVLEVAE